MIYFTANLLIISILYILMTNTDILHKITGYKRSLRVAFDKRMVLSTSAVSFVLSFIIFSIILGSTAAALSISIIPAFCVYGAFDMISRARQSREAGQITYFLMTMSKWSAVRNDMVFCLKKTTEAGIEKPVGVLLERTLGRINGGMDIIRAFSLLEEESSSEDLRYLSRSIRFAAEKGGNLQKLFTGMEQQYFRIDEETFKRKISTVRDRGAVYLTVIIVIATAFWFLLSNPTAGEFYLYTSFGNYLLMAFSAVFATALIFMTGR
ncbi:MAG: hypothetical protein JXN10_02785 [Clostridia bacterium]|nr:hypothetical protein [Clostridia bacterium]MBN2882426.1 hypothetical protein [Clostridia bacterium]